MSKLLHISASPRGARSESLAIAATFVAGFRAAHPHIAVETFDLWDGSLPQFGPPAAAAKMAVFAGADPAGDEARAWRAAADTFARFDSADHYLFSVPMWNAGVPYILKQFIDVVSQPGMVFGFDPERGYTGLLRGKKAAVIYTSAVYGPGRGPEFGDDFQRTYVTSWLRWAGVDDITEISFRPNLATADADAGRRAAHEAAKSAAKTFAAPQPPALHHRQAA
ncbi:MAG TPA: NAD(P)H-dependent oxidoreductase [Pilimelia sp.]|nr:NAD(P)H-dependent oxidoreductase [Pilimelia sp.]